MESHNLIFSSDQSVCFAWNNTRSFKPRIVLHPFVFYEKQVLGVPGNGSGTVAFAFGLEQEDIQSWDLRMPASYAYKMATGNSGVTSLVGISPR